MGRLYRIISNVDNDDPEQAVDGWIFDGDRNIIYQYDYADRLSLDSNNVFMYVYLEAGATYYIDLAYEDLYYAGSFGFKIEYLGEEYNYFRAASPGAPFTYKLDDNGEMTSIIIPGGVEVVLNEDDAIFTLKSGSISAKTQGVRVEKGTFNCEGGTINATNYGVYTANATTANITGGYINSGFDTFNYTVYAPTGSNVTISGGYFNGSAPSGNGLTGGISGGYFARKATNTALLAPDCYYEDITGTTYLFMVVNPNAVPEDPEVPEDVKPVDSWNLVLDDDLTVNFYMNIDAADVTSAQVQVTVDDVPQTFDASGLAVTDDGKYIVSISVAAAQTMDEITVKLTGTSNECEATTYTIRQYADTVLADSSLSKYHALIKEMLNYGAAAQVYFDHNADNLANADINGVGVHEVPDASDNMFTMVNKVDGVVPYGASLVCKDKITVRFYFKVTGDINSFSFSINTEPCEAFKNGDYYCVDVADICPQDLDQQITITVADANGNSMYVSYSPMNYIVSMSANGSDNLKTLVKALYNYHLAAKQLRIS